jgi:predicted DNA-binding transcriptional regulator YafY
VTAKAERLGSLVAALLAGQPRSVREIVETVEGYPPSFDAARVQFIRDRDELRGEAVDIEMIGNGEDARYRIDPATYYLPDLGLTPDEAVALNLAASRVRLDGHDPDEALLKLGGFGAEGPALVALPSDPRLPVLYSALRHRYVVRFSYNGVERDVEGYGVLCRDGFWYVAGFDRTRGDRRNYRVDRIDGNVTVQASEHYEVPAEFDLAHALPDEPYELAPGDAVDVDVWLDAVMAPRGAGEILERRDDGSVVVRLSVSSVPGLRSWLLGMRDHARVLAPASVVDDIRAWLTSIAGGA